MGNVHTAGPNEAMVITEGSSRRTVINNWAWVWWFSCSDIQRLSLEVMEVHAVADRVETADNVPTTATVVAQVKIMEQPTMLAEAIEHFLYKKEHEIKSLVLYELEGHLRAIIGSLKNEDMYKDKEQLASLVEQVAARDVGKLGVEILSLTIKDLYDD